MESRDSQSRFNQIKINHLRENILIKWSLILLILPASIIGGIALVVPYAYMFIPVYETGPCWSYYRRNIPWFDIDNSCFVKTINFSMFVFMNWFLIVVLLYLYHQIRNIKDELNIKFELRLIINIWIVFSISYFFALQCQMNLHVDQVEALKITNLIIFSIIQLRNLLSFSISTFFCYRMTNNLMCAYQEKVEFPTQLYDFEVAVLNSVLPYISFKKYLITYYKECMPFLRIITTYQEYCAFARQLKAYDYEEEDDEKQELERDYEKKFKEIEGIYAENKKLFRET